MKKTVAASALALAVAPSACGEFVRESRSQTQLVITLLEAVSGAPSAQVGTTLRSDVIVGGSIVNDMGRVLMRVQLRDPGQPGITASTTPINAVTISRYRV